MKQGCKYLYMIDSSAAISALGQSLFGAGVSMVQHAINKKDLEESREYNSYKNVIQRLKDASVNPSRALNNGSIMNVQAQDIEPTDIAGNMQSVAGITQNAQQSSLLSAQEDLMRSEAERNRTQSALTARQQMEQQIRNDFLPLLLNLELSDKDVSIALKNSQIPINEEMKKNLIEERNNMIKQGSILSSELDRYKHVIAQAESEAEIAKLRAQFEPDVIQANLQKLLSGRMVDMATCEQLSALALSINADTDIKKVQKQIQDIALKYADELANANLRNINADINLKQSQHDKNYVEITGLQEDNRHKWMLNERMQAGQSVAEGMAVVSEVSAAFGSLLSGAASSIKFYGK